MKNCKQENNQKEIEGLEQRMCDFLLNNILDRTKLLWLS